MTKRIFRTVFIVAIGVFLASTVLFMTALYDYFFSVGQAQLRTELDIAAQGVTNEGRKFFDGLKLKDYRITWIDTDGSVIYESEASDKELENHFQREEVKEALSEGYGESSRYSKTLTERYLYSAKRLSDGTVLRLSMAQKSLFRLTLGMLHPIAVIFVTAVILSAILASRLSKKIVKPLNGLNLDEPLSNEGYDELSPLLRRIDSQQQRIKRQKDELERKQSEFDTVTGGMSEGIVLLNQKGIILSINRAAAELFNTDAASATGSDILSVNRSYPLTQLLYKAESGESSQLVTELNSKNYQIYAGPVFQNKENKEVTGTVLLMLDVTEKEKSEQMRREFGANVSHELKTPLHAISGYAELLAGGMVKSEDVSDFSRRIYAEAGRMISLVEDIIKLSRLDENSMEDMKREDADLFEIAKNAVEQLREEATKSDIELKLYGEHIVFKGVPALLHSIVYNLCDNAIKYNRPGGSVNVSVSEHDGKITLSVSDTGIGIPPEHRERIFERFYRVDKSRSKEIGGTGLGLSIVKHAAKLHSANVNLQSVEGKGSVVTVTFIKSES